MYPVVVLVVIGEVLGIFRYVYVLLLVIKAVIEVLQVFVLVIEEVLMVFEVIVWSFSIF